MRFKAIALSTLALTIIAGGLIAGPLTPTAGPVVSTYKTLSEVEPRIALSQATAPGDADSQLKISSPGSYYLTGNLLVGPGKAGIEVAADDVTIDLNGYRIRAIAGCFAGITTSTNRRNLVIRNGFIENIQGVGISIDPAAQGTVGVRLENLSIQDCTDTGVDAGNNVVVDRVICSNNGFNGFSLGESCVMTACTADNNGSSGIGVGMNSTVTGCSASNNGLSGFNIFGGVLTNCTAEGNGQAGVDAFSYATIRSCAVRANAGGGIEVGDSCVVEGCMCVDNRGSGISAFFHCLIRDNLCTRNNDAGSFDANIVVESACRVEGNLCCDGDIGIKAVSHENFIARNTCRNNTVGWVLDANNLYGPIINRTGVATAAVNGASAAGVLSSSDPNANFTY